MRDLLLVTSETARAAAASLGIPAVAILPGADTASIADTLASLLGQRVFLWAASDLADRRHVNDIALQLRLLGQPADMLFDLVWSGAPPGGDLAAWVARGGQLAELQAMLATAPPWNPATFARAIFPGATPPDAPQFVGRPLAAVESRPIDWLWPRWLARGKLHLLGGLPGDGKSTLLAALAAAGSVGGAWPDGSPAPRSRWLFLLGEDALADTLRPRLDLLGADPEQIFALETVLDGDGQAPYFNIGKHLPLLARAITTRRIDVVAIDPLTSIMAGSDRNAEGDTRDALAPLVKLAERLQVAVIGVAHVAKPGAGSRTAAQRLLGATAFHAMARLVWMTCTCPAPPSAGSPSPIGMGEGLGVRANRFGVRALGVVKSNLALKPQTLLWSRPEDGPILWHGPSPHPIDALLGTPAASSPRADAEAFLRELLAAASLPSGQIFALGKAAGFSERTLRRAADAIDIKTWKEPGPRGRWFWRLPEEAPLLPALGYTAGHEELGQPLRLPGGQLGQLPHRSDTHTPDTCPSGDPTGDLGAISNPSLWGLHSPSPGSDGRGG